MFGGIETKGTFGGWVLVDKDANSLPQDVASGIYAAFETRTEKITPVYYFGYQLVNGMNHAFVARRERTLNDKTVTDYVTFVINIPAELNGWKKAKLVKMEVADETVLTDDAQKAFDATVGKLDGATHKPLLEVGEQTVKGKNYHVICQSQVLYPNAQPYCTRAIINQFGEDYSIVEITHIG